MRWYLNDASLQAQFNEPTELVTVLRELLNLRLHSEVLRDSLYVTHTLSQRLVREGLSLVQLLGQPEHRETQALMLRWLGRGGPFVEDDRTHEADDYFEFEDLDVTDTGLGEAARRVKANQEATTLSFSGGTCDFARSPLAVWYGMHGDRFGQHNVSNEWIIDELRKKVVGIPPRPTTWRELVEFSRDSYSRLCLPNDIYLNSSLAREAFDSVISDKTLALLKYLNQYMEARLPDGSEGPAAQEIIRDHFTGDAADFSGESTTNRKKFKTELSFPDPTSPDEKLFAHWHGKISHRFFRLHFEWPVPAAAARLKVVYLGPKITKA